MFKNEDLDQPSFVLGEFVNDNLTKRETFVINILQGMLAANYSQELRTIKAAINIADMLIEQLGGTDE